MKLSLLYIGHMGAGPVYSLEIARALSYREDVKLQIIISDNVSNLQAWNEAFIGSDVDFHVVKTYNHTGLSALLNCFNLYRQEKVIQLVQKFNSEVLYLPFDLLWSRYIFLRLHRNLKIIFTIHDVKLHNSILKTSAAELWNYFINYGSERYYDGVIILNKRDEELVRTMMHKPVCVIPHACFSYYFKANPNINYSIKKRIGFLGRIEDYKGLDILVDAFEMCKIDGLQLLIAGSGKIEISLSQRITRNNKIVLINRYIKDEEFETIIDSVDFVVLPYRNASQSGIIPMCFAGGKTIIATNVGALSEQVPPHTGLLTEPRPESICRCIEYMYDNPELIKEYGINAGNYANTELSWDRSAHLLIHFINKLLN